METYTQKISTGDISDFKNKMLNWANRFSIFCFLDNCNYQFEEPKFEFMLAAGAIRDIHLQPGSALMQLQVFHNQKPGWLFGHLGYDLKNEIEQLETSHKPIIDFGVGYFFEPEIRIRYKNNILEIVSHHKNPESFFTQINNTETGNETAPALSAFSGIHKQEYLQAIKKIQEHIKQGDCYEMNYCVHFSAEGSINPVAVYNKLTELSPNPFSALYKMKHNYCICASPERYLQKNGLQLISQPIKGTSKRHPYNDTKDREAFNYLKQSQKEKSENVMIVDLVRNDLSRICMAGSIKVKELFGIYAFPQVYQMISTIQGYMLPSHSFTDALQASFPMGSMTGAPKKRVMELIDEIELHSRGLFSGAIGYITPEADFDFNVIIRSIFYNETQKLVSYAAGGGITFYSRADDEYEECLLKATAMRKVLES